jgi:hypothetical protein
MVGTMSQEGAPFIWVHGTPKNERKSSIDDDARDLIHGTPKNERKSSIDDDARDLIATALTTLHNK